MRQAVAARPLASAPAPSGGAAEQGGAADPAALVVGVIGAGAAGALLGLVLVAAMRRRGRLSMRGARKRESSHALTRV
tara:strand:- start:439 stop:672 length:234 start_codon:yes stop_codon:yes gene_type:complete